ncbi:MAG: type I-MYXAN CRISPR-associated protein Cmx8 [Phormidium sp.]
MARKSQNNNSEYQQLELDFAAADARAETESLLQKPKQENSPKNSKKTTTKELAPLVYDPLDPSLTVFHRAGIAGLYLQIKAMEKLREDAEDDKKDNYIIPDYELSEDGRILTIRLTEESFNSLMRERYQGTMVKKVVNLEKHKNIKDKAKKLNEVSDNLEKGETFYRVFVQKIEEQGKEKFEYLVLRPAFNYFKVFNAPLAWQEHIQNSAWNSFLCIYQQQVFFKGYKKDECVSRADELWKSLMGKPYNDLKKHIYPNSQEKDLKGVEIQDTGRRGLLLHFWMLVSTFFTLKGIEYKKSEKTKEKELVDKLFSPIIVVPAVINTEDFTTKFIQELGELPEPKEGSNYLPEKYIASPLEASLAYFAPRYAYYKTSAADSVGMHGVQVCTYGRTGKQAVIREISYESIDEEIVERYKDLLRISSFPYRAMRVQNLIEGRNWHDGFELLLARYPLDLFIAIKGQDDGSRKFDRRALQLVQNIYYDFQTQLKKDKKMNRTSIETLIWRIVKNYVEWRAYNKGNISESEQARLKELKSNLIKPNMSTTDKKKAKDALTKHDKYSTYNKAVLETTADLFINFRGRRDPKNFADAFCETFFRAPSYLHPDQMEQIRSFYEGDEWESGRRLVLMAISAAGALATFGATDNVNDSTDDEDLDVDDQDNSEEE